MKVTFLQVGKRVFKAAKLVRARKINGSSTSQELASHDFW